MPREIWESVTIKNHLLAVYTGQTAHLPQTIAKHPQASAYKKGVDTTFRYLSHRFGLIDDHHLQRTKLRTWNRDDIQAILGEILTIIQQAERYGATSSIDKHNYFAGVCHTLNAVAISFGISEIVG